MPHVANVTVNNSEVSADLTDFRIYVDLSNLPTTEFWGTVANGGGDIRCYKSDGTTELAREVVSCDTATDTGHLHLLFSGTLSSSVDTEIQIWTDEGTEPAVTATYGRNAVWDDSIATLGYLGVWHLHDLTDSTGRGNTLSTSGSPTSGVAGKIGDAYSFDSATSDHLFATYDVSSRAFVASAWDYTLSVWFKTSAAATIVGISNATSVDGYGRLIPIISGGSGNQRLQKQDGTGDSVLHTGGAITPGSWNYSSGYFGISTSRLQDNAAQNTFTGDSTTALSNRNRLGIGFLIRSGGGNPYDGDIQEVRSYDGSLSFDWTATEYANQNSPATFYTASAAGGTPVTVTLANASETDTALPVSVSPIIELDFGFAAETDTAEAITISANVNVALGVASENDIALPTTIAPTQLVTFSAATETDSALPVTVTVDVTVPIGVASEADTALPMEFLTTIFLSLGVADEVDNALRVAINAGGSFSRGALNDAMIQYFNQRGYNGALSGQMIEWLQANGAVSANLPDAWMEMLNAKITAPVESWNDAWFYLLGVNGFTQGTLPDRQLAFFLSNANLLGE